MLLLNNLYVFFVFGIIRKTVAEPYEDENLRCLIRWNIDVIIGEDTLLDTGNIWSQDLQNTPKLRTYRQFKTGFTCEDYVT